MWLDLGFNANELGFSHHSEQGWHATLDWVVVSHGEADRWGRHFPSACAFPECPGGVFSGSTAVSDHAVLYACFDETPVVAVAPPRLSPLRPKPHQLERDSAPRPPCSRAMSGVSLTGSWRPSRTI